MAEIANTDSKPVPSISVPLDALLAERRTRRFDIAKRRPRRFDIAKVYGAALTRWWKQLRRMGFGRKK